MDNLEHDLIVCTVILQMLENKKAVWTSTLKSFKEIRHDDEIERVEMILDSIDMEIERQREQIKYIGEFVIRPTP